MLLTLTDRNNGGSATTRYWLYDVPDSHAHWMLKAICRRQREKARAIAAASGQAVAPDPDSPIVRAVAAYRKAVKETRERYKS